MRALLLCLTIGLVACGKDGGGGAPETQATPVSATPIPSSGGSTGTEQAIRCISDVVCKDACVQYYDCADLNRRGLLYSGLYTKCKSDESACMQLPRRDVLGY